MIRMLRTGVVLLLMLAVVASVGLRLWLRSDAVRATVERQATAAFGKPVRIGEAHATLFPRIGLDLRNVVVGDPAGASVDQVSVATGWALIFSHRVEEADVQLSGGYLDASLAAGIATVHAPARGAPPDVEAPFTIVSLRSIRFRNVNVVVRAQIIPVSLDASLAGDVLDVSSLTAKVGDAMFQIKGQLSSLARHEGHFDVRANLLPVDALLSTLQGPPGDVTNVPFRMTASISAPVATLGGSRVKSFGAQLEATRAGLVFDPLTFDIDAGRFEARLAVNPSGQPPVMDVRGTVSGVNVTRFQDPGSAPKRAMTGTLGARFALRAPVQSTFSGLLDGARGSMDVNVRDGRMPGVEVIRQTVIRFARRDQPAPAVVASDAFSRLDASLVMQAGIARISSLAMKAADFDLAGSGALTLPTSRIALDADVTLSEALSQQAGRDLYRYAREGQRIVLPATIGGTLSAPAVSIDVASAARRALKNRIEDDARSILDRLMKKGPTR
jgi:AsmA-like C-terminal region